MTTPRATNPSNTRSAPAIRGSPCACSLVTAGPVTVARIAPTRTGCDDRRCEPEQPDHAEEDETDADEEPGEQPEVPQPHRRREDARERRRVDPHDRLLGGRSFLRGSGAPATKPVEEPSHPHGAHSLVRGGRRRASRLDERSRAATSLRGPRSASRPRSATWRVQVRATRRPAPTPCRLRSSARSRRLPGGQEGARRRRPPCAMSAR